MNNSASILGFNGDPFDPVSGTYHLGNGYRTYSPVLKQFLSPDNMSPFGAGGINPYAYCAGDPINHSDPSGHFHIGFGSVLGITGVIAGVAAAPFTGGSSLALTAALEGAVLGAVSAGTEIAAENITGSAHNTLAKISLGTGIAGGILDAAVIAGPAIARRLAAGLLNAEREAAGVAVEGKVWTSESFAHEGQAVPKSNGMMRAVEDNTELQPTNALNTRGRHQAQAILSEMQRRQQIMADRPLVMSRSAWGPLGTRHGLYEVIGQYTAFVDLRQLRITVDEVDGIVNISNRDILHLPSEDEFADWAYYRQYADGVELNTADRYARLQNQINQAKEDIANVRTSLGNHFRSMSSFGDRFRRYDPNVGVVSLQPFTPGSSRPFQRFS